MRSVITILLLLIPIGFLLMYTLGRIPLLETFRGSGGHGSDGSDGHRGYGDHGGHHYGANRYESSGSWWGGIFPATYLVAEEPEVVVIKEQPCYTDFDCPSGYCGASGMCTNSLSL